MVKKKLLAMATSFTMMLSMMTGNLAAATYEQGQATPVFCQFYAQNQSGSWEWMSTDSQALNLGETKSLTFNTVDEDGNSLFSNAGEDATFGLQFGDGSLTAGDRSKVTVEIESIKIAAEDYEELLIDLTPSKYEESYLAEEVSWGIQGNNTSISLKDYLGEEALTHLKAITSIELEITLEAYEFLGKTEEETPNEKILFSGEATTSGEWEQAISLYEGSDFKVGDLTADTQVAVTYESSNVPELILQSWSGGPEWIKVAAYKEKEGVAYYSYTDMIEAYSSAMKDYESYNEDFPLLNALHVGDTGAALTVKQVALVVKEAETVDMTYEVGDLTEVFCQFYAQNQSDGWEWMSAGSANLNFGEEQTLKFEIPADTFAIANKDASFGFQFADNRLADGDRSKLKMIIGQMLIKADGYEDVVIKLDPDTYTASYLAEKVSWGITNNSTMISLKDYLGDDFLSHLNAITSCEVTITLSEYSYTKAVEEGSEFEEDYTHPTQMRGLTGKEIVADMKIGWNLGNTLESLGGETAWGNPKTRKKMIDEIKKAGFNTIRVPVTWDDYLGDAPDYTIDSAYLDRVEEVVNYGLANDMYVILNIHHNYGWLEANIESEAAAKEIFTKIWGQVADQFKDYGDQLIFETMNEPRDGDDWTGHSEAYDIINTYNAVCYDTIRQSGGNNTQRLIMMPTYAATSSEAAIAAFKLPNSNDPYVAVSIHAYSPYNFAMDTSATSESTWGTDQDKRALDNLFDSLKTTFIDKGIPVVIGEFGSTNKDNLEYRVAHASYYIQAAKEHGIPCLWWDNGATTLTEGYGLFNRRTLEWVFPEIMEALISACEGEGGGGGGEYDPTILFEGKATSSGWGQADSFAIGTDILLGDLTEGTKIAVVYKSENAPELILQSWSGGPGWVKIAPAEVADGVAYFNYEDMVAGYAAGLTEVTDQAFPYLDRIHIGDTGADLTVTKVYLVLPPVLVDSVSFRELPTLHADETIDLNDYLVILPDNATDKSVKSWSSSNEKVARIDENGVLITYQSGYTTITVTMNDSDLTESIELAVQSHLEYNTSFNVSSTWNGGLNGEIIISNLQETDIEDWTLEFVYDGEIINIWNAKIESHEGNQYTIKNLGWNKTLKGNSSITIGFTANSEDVTLVPHHYNLLTEEENDSSTQYTADLTIISRWDHSFAAEVKLTNISEEPIEGWVITFPFEGKITDNWGFTMSQDGNGNYLFKNLSYNGVIAPGQSITIGFVGTVEGEVANDYEFLGLAG